jgi:hypothetical protein
MTFIVLGCAGALWRLTGGFDETAPGSQPAATSERRIEAATGRAARDDA